MTPEELDDVFAWMGRAACGDVAAGALLAALREYIGGLWSSIEWYRAHRVVMTPEDSHQMLFSMGVTRTPFGILCEAENAKQARQYAEAQLQQAELERDTLQAELNRIQGAPTV